MDNNCLIIIINILNTEPVLFNFPHKSSTGKICTAFLYINDLNKVLNLIKYYNILYFILFILEDIA